MWTDGKSCASSANAAAFTLEVLVYFFILQNVPLLQTQLLGLYISSRWDQFTDLFVPILLAILLFFNLMCHVIVCPWLFYT